MYSRSARDPAHAAARAGTTQSEIARLERGGGNPTIGTLERVLHAAGHRLELTATHQGMSTVDETLIRRQLALSPLDRLRSLKRQSTAMRRLTEAGARARAQRL